MPPPPAAHAAEASQRRGAASWWQLLAGAWVGVPVMVAAFAAVVTAGLPCSANGLVVIAPSAFAAWALGFGWATYCGARRWWLLLATVSATALGAIAGMAAWAAVALDRCFVF